MYRRQCAMRVPFSLDAFRSVMFESQMRGDKRSCKNHIDIGEHQEWIKAIASVALTLSVPIKAAFNDSAIPRLRDAQNARTRF